jgi:hypothetical protein
MVMFVTLTTHPYLIPYLLRPVASYESPIHQPISSHEMDNLRKSVSLFAFLKNVINGSYGIRKTRLGPQR